MSTARLQVDAGVNVGEFSLDVRFSSDAPITALFGRSGSGKSTLLDLIAGLRRPDRGAIRFGGQPLVDVAHKLWVPPHRRRVGYLFQHGHLFPHMSVEANLRYGMLRAGGPSFDDVVQMLEIQPLLDRRPATLSGGERQRTALGRALLSGPELLLLDEPLRGVEQGLRRQILGFFERVLRELQLPVLYVSHSLDELLGLTDHFVVLDRGRVLASGDHLEILASPRLEPLVDRLGLFNLLLVRVVERDARSGLWRGDLAGATVWLPDWEAKAGDQLRVGLRPDDIVLTRRPPSGISLQNCVRAAVVSVAEHGGRVVSRLRMCADRESAAADRDSDRAGVVVCRVTRRAARELELAADGEVFALFKTSALRWL